jgi:tRNA threonylcarbamoyl adenosine modification protein (Sua5/YciO/YrdC/YwlC family)
VSILSATAERAVDEAVTALLAGQAVVIPTDTVYGVGVSATLESATDLLFALKDRPSDVPVAILVASLDQAADLAQLPAAGSAGAALLDLWWPGPLTVVLRRRAGSGLAIGGDGTTVGIRWPASELVQAIAGRAGPLAVTSANRHGEPTPADAAGAAASLTGPVTLVLDGGRLDGVASTVVDLTGAAPVVLREGAVSTADIVWVSALA